MPRKWQLYENVYTEKSGSHFNLFHLALTCKHFHCCCLVATSCLILCNIMNCSWLPSLSFTIFISFFFSLPLLFHYQDNQLHSYFLLFLTQNATFYTQRRNNFKIQICCQLIITLKKKGDFPGAAAVKLPTSIWLLMQGEWVQSMVRELRFRMLPGTGKKIKN